MRGTSSDASGANKETDTAVAFTDRLKAVAGVVAPTTVATALLLYFGYVATLARFRYFGIYLDLVGLSNQQLLLYGVEVVYVPLAVIGIAGLFAAGLHATVQWLRAEPIYRNAAGIWIAVVAILAAMLLLLRALVGILRPQVTLTETPGTTPICLSLGALLATYGGWIGRAVMTDRYPDSGAPAWYDRPALIRIVLATAAVVGVAGLFWASNSFAGAYGTGRALDDAEQLAAAPEVLLDTKTRLYGLSPEVARTEQALPLGQAGPFRYRYRGLRLLTAADGWLFLVPAPWSERTSRTLVVPFDGDVRIQLVP